MNFFEQQFIFNKSPAACKLLKIKKISKLLDDYLSTINSLIPLLDEVVWCVLSHYSKRITFAHVDIPTIFTDLRSECYIGLVKGLIRLSAEYKDDVDKVLRYLMKVVRSHVKNMISVMLLSARIPQSRWYKVPPEIRNHFIPISLNNMNNNHDTSCEEGVDDKSDGLCSVDFPYGSLEFFDFVVKLPSPYKDAILSLLEGGEDTTAPPLILTKLFALYALTLFRKLG